MDVRLGWAAEYGRQSIAVQLDEVDLQRLVMEYGAGIGTIDLTTGEAFRVLSLDAERFVQVQVAEKHGGDMVAAMETHRHNTGLIREILTKAADRKMKSNG